MADSLPLLFALETFNDFELIIDELLDEDNDVIFFSAIGRFTRRSLNRIHDYVEITGPSYLPSNNGKLQSSTRGL